MATAVGLERALLGASGGVRRDVQDVLTSGQYYVTPQLSRELQHLHNGVQLIRLDQDLRTSSKDWGAKFDPTVTATETAGASQVLGATSSTMHNLKSNLDSRRMRSLMDNQARQTHHQAMSNLKEAEMSIGPYAHASVDRIKQFCNHVGVTDRYTGYRNNLNRGSEDPVRKGFSWLDSTNKSTYNGSMNVGWKPSTATGNQVPARHSLPAPGSKSAPPLRSMSLQEPTNNIMKHQSSRCIQEQCGINMTFPGSTEYMNRYTRPRPFHEVLPDYRINPAPDFTIYGRPNARAEVLKNSTEYQTRYEWPDSAKIDKQPWIRV